MNAIFGVALLAVCAFGQTFENLPIKMNTQLMGNLMGNKMISNPLLTTTDFSGMKTFNGEWNTLLTIQELIQHPLFQVYYQIPLFKQHFNHPLFQVYLVSPHFQTYWTHPLFPTFFNNQVLFYKYIYPQVFNTQVQTPIVNMPVSWINKMIPDTQVMPTNYDELVQKVLGVDSVQKNMNIQGLYWDKIMKNTFMNINKPEEVTEVKTEVKIPVPTIANQMDKMTWGEKMIEESPMEILMKEALLKDSLVKDSLVKDSLVKDTLVKDSIVKDDLFKETLLKKFYMEKMMNKMNINKMTPEEFLLFQNKMETIIPSRIRRNANYVQIPSTFNYNTYNKDVKALPFWYNVPTAQQIYYTQPQTTFTNTVGTPFNTYGNTQYTNTVGTPFINTLGNTQYTNTVGTPFINTLGNTQYTNTVGTPFVNTVGTTQYSNYEWGVPQTVV